METIFDYNPTADELKQLGITMSKEEYIKDLLKWDKIEKECDKKAGVVRKYTAEPGDYALAALFLYRGDKQRMEKYLSRFAPVGTVERADWFRHKTIIKKGSVIYAT